MHETNYYYPAFIFKKFLPLMWNILDARYVLDVTDLSNIDS